jgi:hypothetical protein
VNEIGKLADLSLGLAALVGSLWIVLLIIRAIRKNGNDHPKGDLERRVAALEEDKEEVEKLRKWRHDISTPIGVLAFDYENRTGRHIDLP